jgi:ribonucleoside-diphosphate reductase alpha chain
MKRYNHITLKDIQQAVEENENIEISNQDTIQAPEIIIIKRDGREEPFNIDKLNKVVQWATQDDFMSEELIRDTKIKLHKKIHIKDMYSQLITTAANKISMLYPMWEEVAGRLKLLEIYKETYNMKTIKDYPYLGDVLNKGVEYRIYDKDLINQFSEEEIKELNDAIIPERDFLFTFKSLTVAFNKYCLNYTKTRKLELPQITYMRVAMQLMIKEKDRVKRIIQEYNMVSTHSFTRASPKMINALTHNPQLSSCVLCTLDDDTTSILDTGKNLGIYSKFKGGTALDISPLRSRGSYIEGNQGISSGPVSFLKYYESIMKGWNQGSTRPGALCVYFPWWVLDVSDILSLKSNGGTEENRARGLKYAIKINNLFLRAVKEDDDIYLFDPKDVPKMLGVFGEEFEEAYTNYSARTNIRKKKIKARDLLYEVLKHRTETGNIYIFHEENVNNATLLNRYIGSSNLCTEVLSPSRPSILLKEELVTGEEGETTINKYYKSGEIALCNLSSLNLVVWHEATEEEKQLIIATLVRGLDNAVDVANYPVKEAKYSNNLYRYLGIGVSNYANYLALNKILIDTQEALEETDRLFDDLSYRIISASVDLAIEKGKFPKFYETEWAQGILPIDKANKNAIALTKYEPDWDKWNKLRERIKTFGIRNAQLMAIAPTATTGKAINATESTEPILDYSYKEDGTISVSTIVPNFRKNNQYYVKAFDCDPYKLIELAAIRQKWVDQAGSNNEYERTPKDFMELTKRLLYASHLGIKTWYYFKQQKENEEYTCESCT